MGPHHNFEKAETYFLKNSKKFSLNHYAFKALKNIWAPHAMEKKRRSGNLDP